MQFRFQSAVILSCVVAWAAVSSAQSRPAQGPGRGRGAVPRTEHVDNYLYASWAKFNPGASVTFKETMEMKLPEQSLYTPSYSPTFQVETTSTYTLVEVEPSQIILRLNQTTTQDFRTREALPQRVTIPAKIERGQELVSMRWDQFRHTRQIVRDLQEWKETFEIMGKKVSGIRRDFMTEIQEGQQEQVMTASQLKGWYVDAVPGALVKSEAISRGPLNTVTKVNLVSWTTAPGVPGTMPGEAVVPATQSAN